MFFSPNTRLSSLFSRYTYVMRFTFLSLRRVVPALHALVFQLLAVRTRVARQQSYFTLPCEHRFCTMSRQNGFADTPARTFQVIANRAPRVVPAPRASWESIFSDGRHGTNNFYYASQQRPLSQIRPVFPGSTLPRTQCGSARLARWSRASARA